MTNCRRDDPYSFCAEAKQAESLKAINNENNDGPIHSEEIDLSVQFTEPLPILWFDTAHLKSLHILPYDLNSDELILNDHLAQRVTNSNFQEIRFGNS